MRIVITGANRGIGLELVRQSLARGDEVIAAVRKPEAAPELQKLAQAHAKQLTVLACDVADDASVQAFAQKVPSPVDALVNNAGVMGQGGGLSEMDFNDALKTLSANALGPLRVTRALLPQLRKSGVKKVLHVSSGMGSIGDNQSGGYYAYRMSKAALNMASRNAAIELKRDGILSAVISPGWVKTDMGGQSAPTEVETSVKGILTQLDALSPESSGEFLDYSGKHWPW